MGQKKIYMEKIVFFFKCCHPWAKFTKKRGGRSHVITGGLCWDTLLPSKYEYVVQSTAHRVQFAVCSVKCEVLSM